MGLIDQYAAIRALEIEKELCEERSREKGIDDAIDAIRVICPAQAVLIDDLCEWMADNVYLKDDTGGAWELNSDNWKKVLTKWKDVKVNHESNGEH